MWLIGFRVTACTCSPDVLTRRHTPRHARVKQQEPNHHRTYVLLLETLGNKDLSKQVLKTTYYYCRSVDCAVRPCQAFVSGLVSGLVWGALSSTARPCCCCVWMPAAAW